MKRAGIFLATLFGVLMIGGTASAQTTYTWNQSVSSDYSVALNWTPTRLTPATSDILVFDGNTTPTPTVTNVQAETIGRLRVINGANPTISATAERTLTL